MLKLHRVCREDMEALRSVHIKEQAETFKNIILKGLKKWVLVADICYDRLKYKLPDIAHLMKKGRLIYLMLHGGLNLPFNLLIMYRCSLCYQRGHWQRDLLVTLWQAEGLFVWTTAQQVTVCPLCIWRPGIRSLSNTYAAIHSKKQFFTRRRGEQKHYPRLSQ